MEFEVPPRPKQQQNKNDLNTKTRTGVRGTYRPQPEPVGTIDGLRERRAGPGELATFYPGRPLGSPLGGTFTPCSYGSLGGGEDSGQEHNPSFLFFFAR